jgi:hypothetical protein
MENTRKAAAEKMARFRQHRPKLVELRQYYQWRWRQIMIQHLPVELRGVFRLEGIGMAHGNPNLDAHMASLARALTDAQKLVPPTPRGAMAQTDPALPVLPVLPEAEANTLYTVSPREAGKQTIVEEHARAARRAVRPPW